MTDDTPEGWRTYFRQNRGVRTTAGLAPGYVQANLVVLPREYAWDFLLFCHRNPKPCPLLDFTEPGGWVPRLAAPHSDLRTDLPGYAVYQDGAKVAEVDDISGLWRSDLVAFLLGCNFSMDVDLKRQGVPVPHMDAGTADAMFISTIETVPAGVFQGPVVVSMRAIPGHLITKTVQITSRYPLCHGAPMHIGSPSAIGIHELGNVDYGEVTLLADGDCPVFWGCGVTPQAIAARNRLPFMITHQPGHMFITDLTLEDVRAY